MPKSVSLAQGSASTVTISSMLSVAQLTKRVVECATFQQIS